MSIIDLAAILLQYCVMGAVILNIHARASSHITGGGGHCTTLSFYFSMSCEPLTFAFL